MLMVMSDDSEPNIDRKNGRYPTCLFLLNSAELDFSLDNSCNVFHNDLYSNHVTASGRQQ